LKLLLKNKSGSRQHYYHFLLGNLFPLINWCNDHPSTPVTIKSCAVCNKHFDNLGLPVTLVDKLQGWDQCIDGYDMHYEGKGQNFSMGFGSQLPHIISASKWLLKKAQCKQTNNKILMINRTEPLAFYKSDESENKTSGIERRSIPNFIELYDKVCEMCPNVVKLIYPEEHTLFEQIEFFNNADIVIAQHGAALVNMVFCKPDRAIIEISSSFNTAQRMNVRVLAENLGHHHIPVDQDEEHSPVDVNKIVSAVKDALVSIA
tara:strand:+ start:464 stop:1246 length:783 start_codon:yes stop_codon:yes gene_type:complete